MNLTSDQLEILLGVFVLCQKCLDNEKKNQVLKTSLLFLNILLFFFAFLLHDGRIFIEKGAVPNSTR